MAVIVLAPPQLVEATRRSVESTGSARDAPWHARHAGFDLHAGRTVRADDCAGLERLLHYSTTMIYTHVLNRGPGAVRSPANRLGAAPDAEPVPSPVLRAPDTLTSPAA